MATKVADKQIKYDRSVVILAWKDQIFEFLQNQHPEKKLSRAKVDAKLDRIIQENLKNPKVSIINNYTNQNVRSDVLTLMDLIEDNHLIIGGGGTIFHQHETKRNLLIDFIIWIMDQRAFWKKERKKYKKGTYEYHYADLLQLMYKLIINSLYGCMGYPGFVLYNVFLAEAITNQGRHIITTAIACFEGFLGDAMKFDTKTELFNYIGNISREYKSKYEGNIDISIVRRKYIYEDCIRRLIEKCTFKVDTDFTDLIRSIIYAKSEEEVTVLYYKNNLLKFFENEALKSRFRMVLNENGPLMVPYSDKLKDDAMREIVEDTWKLIDIFVFYDYPVYDRLRKAMYQDKSRCLYTDTDSVFISLDHLCTYCEEDVLKGEIPAGMTPDLLSSTAANIMMIFVNYAIDRALKTLCESCNVLPKWAARLGMKNEFFFKKILFTEKKKRYISLALLQEGVLLNDGKGLDEIKGFDFKKATTKDYLREYYTDICLNDILYPANIDPSIIFRKMVALRDSIEVGARSGDMKFFKQSAVKTTDQYKNPYETQGVTAILFWNAMCPDYQLEFPNDVNIVPVIDLRWEAKKGGTKLDPLQVPNIAKFAEKYPEYYDRLYQEIYSNPNEKIQHMGMKYIATPKNPDIPVPDVIYDIIDYDKLVSDALGLFLPIMNSIGIKSLSVGGNTEAMTNLVEL